MRWAAKIRLRMRSLLRPGAVDRELEAELAYHRAAAGEVHKTAGRDAEWEACRDQRRVAAVENFLQDSYRAARRLARTPGFTLTAVLVLGFGMAAATAMFSLSDAVLQRPLPGVANGRGLVHLERVEGGVLLGDLTYPDYQDYASQADGFATLAATANNELTVTRDGWAEQVYAELVTGNYFATFKLRPERGRLIEPFDQAANANRVAVISDALWRRRFGADPSVVGSTLNINQYPLTIVGVAPQAFAGATEQRAADLWVPITTQPTLMPLDSDCLLSRSCGWITALGRLAPGTSLAQAQAEIATVEARITAVHPDEAGRHARVAPGIGIWSDDRASETQLLGLLLGVTLLLVAMSGAAVGSLFLARCGSRQREVATQLALGAGRGRVVQQLLLEGGWIAAAGAMLGVAAAEPLARWLLILDPTAPRNVAVSLDGRVLGFAALAAVACALVAALAPALLAARSGLQPAMRQGGGGASARHATQRWLIAGQIAVSLLLLITAGLATRTLQAATAGAVPPGATSVDLVFIKTEPLHYTGVQGAALFGQLQARLEAQPGVSAAVVAACIPPSDCMRNSAFAAGAEPPPEERRIHEFSYPVRPDINLVSPGFFRMFSLAFLSGRNFGAGDRGGARVCIINQSLAARLWPDGPALGQRLALPLDQGGPDDYRIVGVVADRRTSSLLDAAHLQVYLPGDQLPPLNSWLAVSSPLPRATVDRMIQAQLTVLAPGLAISHGRSLADQIMRSLWQPLALASLAGGAGLLAALLAAIGLFGTLAQLVAERRRELGIRLALGATRRRLAGMVVRHGILPVSMGLGAGAAAGVGLTRLVRPFLFGVTPLDTAAWAGAVVLLGGVALLAIYLAAARTAAVQPAEALRAE